MGTFFGKATLAASLAACVALTAAPAEARDRYWRDRGGNDAAIAIGAGLVGLAIGAAIADDNDDRYYDRRYYGDPYYYPRYRGHYYNDYPAYRHYPRYRYKHQYRYRDRDRYRDYYRDRRYRYRH